MARGDGHTKDHRFRIGVALQTAFSRPVNGIDHARRRRVGILVGVELDQIRDPRLLAGHVWLERRNARAPKRWNGRQDLTFRLSPATAPRGVARAGPSTSRT